MSRIKRELVLVTMRWLGITEDFFTLAVVGTLGLGSLVGGTHLPLAV